MSNTEKTMVILWIAISFILSASGQTNYIFRNINIQHGLPDNQIKGLATVPSTNVISASTVGFPLESRISLPTTFSISK